MAQIKSEFLVERQGRAFALYAGLLDTAHTQCGLKSIRTRLVQVPGEDNGQTAIVHATIEVAAGVFEGLGDASPSNCARSMVTALIRLAETRAKARALRDAVNQAALVAVEELVDSDGEIQQRVVTKGDGSRVTGDGRGPRPASDSAPLPGHPSPDTRITQLDPERRKRGLARYDALRSECKTYGIALPAPQDGWADEALVSQVRLAGAWLEYGKAHQAARTAGHKPARLALDASPLLVEQETRHLIALASGPDAAATK